MTFAQIQNEVVQNVISLKNDSLLNFFQTNPLDNSQYDFVIRIDLMYPRPGIGWGFDGIQFIAPPIMSDDNTP